MQNKSNKNNSQNVLISGMIDICDWSEHHLFGLKTSDTNKANQSVTLRSIHILNTFTKQINAKTNRLSVCKIQPPNTNKVPSMGAFPSESSSSWHLPLYKLRISLCININMIVVLKYNKLTDNLSLSSVKDFNLLRISGCAVECLLLQCD